MKPSPISVAMLVVSLLLAPALLAQSPDSANQSAASPAASAAEVPRLIKFSGTLLDAQDRTMAGPVGVTFALHAQQTGGAALWLETQNVKPDANGVYSVLLGANSANGVPAELFASGEARWLEVQVERQEEQPRVLLVSVPYALKAKDAETLGGKPASAFVTTETLAGAGNSAGGSATAPTSATALPSSKAQTTPKKAASAPQPAVACTSVTSDGTATASSISKFTAPCTIQNSTITENGGNVGIGTTTPTVAVDVAGNNAGLRLSGTGTHQVTVTGLSSGRLGQDANGFFFASDTNGKTVRFLTNNGTLNEWMRVTSAGNVGIGTTTPGAKLEIAGGNLALPNTTSSSVGVVTLGGVPFLHNFPGTPGSNNTFVGASAGNMNMTGGANAAVGASALASNTTGGANAAFGFGALENNTAGGNAAFGFQALQANTTGTNNDAFGGDALLVNTTGGNNSAFGGSALFSNTAGSGNSAFGFQTLASNITGNVNSAFGFNALNFNTASGNSAFGALALFVNTTGASNSAFGNVALFSNTTGAQNSAFGDRALTNTTTGAFNSAFGWQALQSNTTACCNTAFGSQSLQNNTTGSLNDALGGGALLGNITGSKNSAFGDFAMGNNTTGDDNAAFGQNALSSSSTGAGNTALGTRALNTLGSGNSNIAIGREAASSLSANESNDIYIGNQGVAGESNTIRVGSVGTQTKAFIAGVSGATLASGVAVFVNSSSQLGVAPSSRRFKDDIADMGGESDLLMKLRPVSFYYKPELDETHTRQYGLVAEEVAQLSPQLVVFDKDGVPQTVRYHFVNAMLLNEVQKQQSTIARQQTEIHDLAARLAKLEALVAPLP
jgi:endosialidase-like protein